jgi:hypothetical protein
MPDPELWLLFDRLKAGLDKQEARRGREGFEEWVQKALPLFQGYVDPVRAAEQERYGDVLCAWFDWLEARRLLRRGEVTWKIPTKGPLIFHPPTMDGLMAVAATLMQGAAGPVTAPSARSSSESSPKIRRASGRRGAPHVASPT